MLKNLIYIFVLALSVLTVLTARGQGKTDEKQRQQLIERIIENKEGGADYTDLQDQLDYFLNNPISLNHCQAEPLRQLSFLTEIQVQAILRHRSRFGPFLAYEELQVINELPQEQIQLLLPFISIDTEQSGLTPFKKMIKYAGHDFIALFQQQAQENEGQRRRISHDTVGKDFYHGNALRQVLRYRMAYKNQFAIGFTGEKDAGETFGRGINPKGFDFNSAYLYLGERKYIKKLIVGDFNLMLGQGLTFGSGLSFGKSAMVMNVKRNSAGIRPYRSVNENEFLRGVGTNLKFGKTSITLFASRKKIDGNISGDTLQGEDASFSSIISSGFHRTAAEQADKHTISQFIYGGRISHTFNRFEIGINAASIQFGQPFIKNSSLYNQFSFNGNNDIKAGFDYSYNYRNLMAFGEVSKNSSGGYAQLHSIMISLSQRLDYILVYRKYDRNFKPILSNGWGESSQNENESGCYQGFAARLGKGLSITGYFDVYRSAWLKYRIYEPFTLGHDALLETAYNPSKTVSIYLRYRTETKPGGTSNADYFRGLENYTRQSLRAHIQVKVNKQLTLKSRMEISQWGGSGVEKQQGVTCFQDLDWKSENGKWNLSTRWTMFQVNGFNARIYAYEDDMIYTFSVPMFLNRGFRTFLLSRYKLNRRAEIWFKIAHTQYYNLNMIGSGLDAIQGSGKTDIKIQLRMQLGKKI